MQANSTGTFIAKIAVPGFARGIGFAKVTYRVFRLEGSMLGLYLQSPLKFLFWFNQIYNTDPIR